MNFGFDLSQRTMLDPCTARRRAQDRCAVLSFHLSFYVRGLPRTRERTCVGFDLYVMYESSTAQPVKMKMCVSLKPDS